jgi:hypothetical protein
VRVLLLLALASGAIACRSKDVEGQPALTPVATTREIMDGIVIPDSQAIFNAVAYENAQLRAPKGDDEWSRLKMQALAVAEAGNLLIMPPRSKDNRDWVRLSRLMTTTAAAVAKAADSKDPDAVLLAGGDLYESCTACHSKYLPQ